MFFEDVRILHLDRFVIGRWMPWCPQGDSRMMKWKIASKIDCIFLMRCPQVFFRTIAWLEKSKNPKKTGAFDFSERRAIFPQPLSLS